MAPSINQELMGRMAAGLEEAGHALKVQSVKLTQLCVQVGSLETQSTSDRNRLEKVEEKIDGNGSIGLRTEIAVIRKEVNNLSENVKNIQNWRRELGDKKFSELKDENRQNKNLRWMIILTTISIIIALTSLVSTCAPKLIKVFSEEEVKIEKTTTKK